MSVTGNIIPQPPDAVIAQATPEQQWHRERAKGIGGSEVHHLFPVLDLNDKAESGSRYGCPRLLSYQKLGVEPDYQYTPETLRLFERGHLLEEAAAQKYAQQSGIRVFRSNIPYVSEAHPFMRCNIDRRIKITDDKRRILECKSANEHVFGRMKIEGLPIGYALQLQHSIEATGSDGGSFAVIESPDYVDAVIEQIEDERLRNKVLDTLAPKFDFFSFEVERNDDLIAMIVEAEQKFWNLVEQKKLADPIPCLADDRCKSCNFRKTCRGQAYADANNAVPVRDKKGVQYVQIDSPAFADAARDRVVLMKDIAEKEELLAAVDVELKQNLPAGVTAVQLAGTGIKLSWNYQRGAVRWDADALKADSAKIGKALSFMEWADNNAPEYLANFESVNPVTPSLADKYQAASAPIRPFRFTVKE